MSLNLKSILKTIKLNESKISMALGVLVLFFIGILVIKFNQNKTSNPIKIPNTKQEEVKNNAKKLNHTVATGETLWSIAEKYYNSGYNWTDIARENNLSNPNLIEEGQIINLPNVESANVTVKSMNNNVTPINSDQYIVNRGDNLWEIAIRTYGDGYKWVDIAKENNLSNPNIIHPGNVLKLP